MKLLHPQPNNNIHQKRHNVNDVEWNDIEKRKIICRSAAAIGTGRTRKMDGRKKRVKREESSFQNVKKCGKFMCTKLSSPSSFFSASLNRKNNRPSSPPPQPRVKEYTQWRPTWNRRKWGEKLCTQQSDDREWWILSCAKSSDGCDAMFVG